MVDGAMRSSDDPAASDTAAAGRGRRGKVARLIEEYDLAGLGETLERRWTAEGDERASLRELADLFNRELLDAALREAGVHALDGEVANSYRLLVDDEVSSGDRTRARRRLEREGVDVDALEGDFVSYQAVRTYLQDERGATYERAATDRVAAARDTIEQLGGRTASVAEGRVEHLVEAGDLAVGSVSAVVDVRIRCDDCGEQYTLDELLDRGRCGCDDP